MNPAQSLFLLACFFFIVYLCYRAFIRKFTLPGSQKMSRYLWPNASTARVEISNGRQKGCGWVPESGEAVLSNRAIARVAFEKSWGIFRQKGQAIISGSAPTKR